MVLILVLTERYLKRKNMIPARMKLEMLKRYQHVVKIKRRLKEIQQMVNGANVQNDFLSTHVVMVSTQELTELSQKHSNALELTL